MNDEFSLMAPGIPLRHRLSGVAILIAAVLFFSWYGMNWTCGCAAGGDGVLEGTVTIGPLCPVEPCLLSKDQIAAAYDARKVVVYSWDGSTVVRDLSVDPDAGYHTTLPAGRYVVDINHVGIDSSDDVPREIEIRTGETVRVDIAIDTGIR